MHVKHACLLEKTAASAATDVVNGQPAPGTKLSAIQYSRFRSPGSYASESVVCDRIRLREASAPFPRTVRHASSTRASLDGSSAGVQGQLGSNPRPPAVAPRIDRKRAAEPGHALPHADNAVRARLLKRLRHDADAVVLHRQHDRRMRLPQLDA